MLSASGIQFGLLPTLPHVIGTSTGIGAMAVAMATGLGVLVTTVPEIEIALKVTGSAYLLFLAFQVAGSQMTQERSSSRPLSLTQATVFQFANPKAWVFVLAALTTFRPTGYSIAVGSALMVVTMMVVVLPSAMLWAAGGSALKRLVRTQRASRIVSLTLAVLLAGTVAYIWT